MARRDDLRTGQKNESRTVLGFQSLFFEAHFFKDEQKAGA
jgi:hypothetical protein